MLSAYERRLVFFYLTISIGTLLVFSYESKAEEFPAEIADAVVVVRLGIDDLGAMTVRKYEECLYSSPLLNKEKGCEWNYGGWFSKSNHYDLTCHYKKAILFRFIPSKNKELALLKVYAVARGRELPAMYMTAMLLGCD